MIKLILSPEFTDQLLHYLCCSRKSPSIRYLNQLITAYIENVPWESVTRIVKRHNNIQTTDCPRWPEEFWNDAFSIGTGGTCFECNLAFYALLITLGFQGYLTINNLQDNQANHTASVITIRAQKYLVDVAIPIYCAIPIYSDRFTKRSTPMHTYTILPSNDSTYRVERSHHPKREIYILLDTPISMDAYRAAVENDYKKGGYFLDRVLIVKYIKGKLWRFSSNERPFKMEGFSKKGKQEIVISPDKLARTLEKKFGLQEVIIAKALKYLQVLQ